MSRPSEYSDAVAEEICRRLSHGESLRAICESREMPAKSTVLRWLDQQQDFRTQYARAREEQADHHAEEIIAIADLATTGEDAQVARVRIDARKWFASKVAPKRYGDKLEHEHSGNVTVILAPIGDDRDGNPPPA